MKLLSWLFCLLIAGSLAAQKPEIIVCLEVEDDSLMSAAGYRYFVTSIAKHLSPRNVTREQFVQKVAAFKKLKTGIFAYNIFLPGDLKVVGPGTNDTALLEYTDEVFRRCVESGVTLVIWGSGGSRRVPEGFDFQTAKEQFVASAKKVAKQAGKHGITLALENLNTTETNFINSVSLALEIVKKVDEPNFRLCVDIYHMLMDGEGPQVIETTGKYLLHCDIAERENRAPPGTKGDDFTPYLRALKSVRFKGKIALECRWPNVAREATTAKTELQRQIDLVWK